MAESNPINFQPYLQSLITTYQHWQERYTLTDVVGRAGVSASSDTTNTAPQAFDFGLMVQTVTQQNEDEFPSEEQKETKEKVERFPVLEGIRKYADDHVLLIGRPGSGKSTALLRLLLEEAIIQGSDAFKASDPSSPIPVLVELRYFCEIGKSTPKK
ncbi:MAG: NTPase (NACHT family) [Cyanobacteria bacterium J06638_20]